MRMQSKSGASGEEAREPVTRDITQNGMTVRIVAQAHPAHGWMLRVIGRRGQVSEWTQPFDSAAEAITTALTAIRYEGIEDFYEDPIFRDLERLRPPLH
jgi:hypothetical protein